MLADSPNREGNWKYINIQPLKNTAAQSSKKQMKLYKLPWSEKPNRKQNRKVMSNLTQKKLHIN